MIWPLHGPVKMEYREEPIPQIASTEVLIKVKATGICGSDFHQVEDLNGNGVSLNSLPESERELAQRLKIGEFTIHVKRKGEGT